MARATAVNKHTVQEFFNNAAIGTDKTIFFQTEFIRWVKHVLQPFNVPNETVVQPFILPNTFSEKGVKQVGAITSAKRGGLVALICAIIAVVISIPPMVVFPRVTHQAHFTQLQPVDKVFGPVESVQSSLRCIDEAKPRKNYEDPQHWNIY